MQRSASRFKGKLTRSIVEDELRPSVGTTPVLLSPKDDYKGYASEIRRDLKKPAAFKKIILFALPVSIMALHGALLDRLFSMRFA